MSIFHINAKIRFKTHPAPNGSTRYSFMDRQFYTEANGIADAIEMIDKYCQMYESVKISSIVELADDVSILVNGKI